MIIYGPEDLKTEFELSPGIAAKLQIYADLLTKWQARINLVGKNTLPELWHRHFRDSAQLAAYMDHTLDVKYGIDTKDVMDGGGAWLDIGSGAGFPGLVLAIMRSDGACKPVHLIESDQRKAVFLREVIRATQAPAMVHNRRIESLDKHDFEGTAQLITARALAPMEEILRLTENIRCQKTKYLLLKGQDVDRELTQAAKYMNMKLCTYASRTDPAGLVLEITEVARV